jgi:hypothetical protein
MHSEAFISLNSDCFSKCQYVLRKNICRCKRTFSSSNGSHCEFRPPLWLSSIKLRYVILGKIPLVEGSAGPKDLYLTTHNFHETHIYAPAGFEHTNPASQRSWTLTLDRV